MKKEQSIRHLRLVSDQAQHSCERERRDYEPVQISMPFPDTAAVYFVLVATMTQDEFLHVIDSCVSSWLIDVRTVPRFDSIFFSRDAAFRFFKEHDVLYVDFFGLLGVKSYQSVDSNPAIWGDALRDLLKNSKRKGPYLLLFDEENHLRTAYSVLPQILRPVVGTDAYFSKIVQRRVPA